MAKKKTERHKNEQEMLDNIAGRDEAAGAPAAQKQKLSIGWIVIVGSFLWMMVLCGAGYIAWLAFANGA